MPAHAAVLHYFFVNSLADSHRDPNYVETNI